MIEHQVNSVFLPESIFIGLRVLVLHVAHVNIHKGRARKEMLCLAGNNGDLKITLLAYVTRGCNSGNTVTNDDDMFHALQR